MDDKKTQKQKGQKQETPVETDLEIETLKAEVQDYKNKYLRALADYQNLDRRMGEERERMMKLGVSQVVLRLLPFLDHLEKAEMFVKDPGLKLIKDNFMQVLKDTGITELDVLNKPFDPTTAEAIDMVEGEEDDKVVEVLRKGYEFEGRILRVAQVKVSKKKVS